MCSRPSREKGPILRLTAPWPLTYPLYHKGLLAPVAHRAAIRSSWLVEKGRSGPEHGCVSTYVPSTASKFSQWTTMTPSGRVNQGKSPCGAMQQLRRHRRSLFRLRSRTWMVETGRERSRMGAISRLSNTDSWSMASTGAPEPPWLLLRPLASAAVPCTLRFTRCCEAALPIRLIKRYTSGQSKILSLSPCPSNG
jgi:hypothetical protein